jgi:hypothetical protein
VLPAGLEDELAVFVEHTVRVGRVVLDERLGVENQAVRILVRGGLENWAVRILGPMLWFLKIFLPKSLAKKIGVFDSKQS